jgi:ABC-type dipeptide/oligopeptide/nickel transport system permease subunit
VNWLKKSLLYLINPRSDLSRLGSDPDRPLIKKSVLKGIFNPPMVLGLLILIGLLVIILFGPLIATYDPFLTSQTTRPHFDTETNKMVTPPFEPSLDHPLGTDAFGNDILSLIFYGARVTLVTCFYITIARVIIGLVLGGLSGWFEGSWLDRSIMSVGGVIASFPLLLSSMIMIYALDITKGLWVFVVTISVLGWTEIAQLVRGEFIRIREMLYIEAAEALGLTRTQVVVRHALPNVISYLFSILFLEMGAVLLLLAELGYLGVFIGGGSVYNADPLSPVVVQINEVPEWGALVAQGAPSLRSYPFMVLGPAAAFFVAIIGLNALGEGIRRIFERWPFSTAFLLKKRMVLILAASVALTMFIFEKTNAEVSYHKLGSQFNAERAYQRVEKMQALDPYAPTVKENQLVSFLKDEFREYDAGRGYSAKLNSFYHFPARVTLVRPEGEPMLRTEKTDRFQLKKEFGYLTRGCAGEGQITAPLAVLGGSSILEPEALDSYEIKDRIVLVDELRTRDGFIDRAAQQGAAGLLLVSHDQQILSEMEMEGDQSRYLCPQSEIPVYRVSAGAASQLSAQAGIPWKGIEAGEETEGGLVVSELEVTMDLDLGDPQEVEVPNAIGFYGGYDMENAAEIVVVFTSYDGLGLEHGQSGTLPTSELINIASLLEIMQTWQEGSMDPRRSVMFVIWGGEGVEGPFFDLMYGLYEVNKLVAEVPTNSNPFVNDNPVKPAYWFDVGLLGTSSDQLAYSASSSRLLAEEFEESVRKATLDPVQVELERDFIHSRLPELRLWDPEPLQNNQQPDLENWALKGEAISHTLVRLLREVD